MRGFPHFAALAGGIVLSFSGGAFAQSSDQKPILPGYWSYKAATVLDASSTGRQCVRPDKIDEFLSGPHNRHYTCTYPSREVGGGEARFSGVCVDKHGKSFKIQVSGAYTQTHFQLRGHISGVFILPMTLPISIEAQWISSECPPGSK